MGGTELKYIKEAFDTNWISQIGNNIDCFENNLEKYLGENSFVTALSSGTAAIHMALRLLNVEEGDFVICQSFTFVASVNPVSYLKAIPVLVDSEPSTLNICPDALEDAVKFCLQKGRKPKAIIAINLYGMPFMIDEVLEISRKYDIPLIEDSAEALGSKYNNRKCGTFGDLSIISFNGNKIITTSGGGALITKNQTLKNRALYLATQAKEDVDFYSHSELGYNYRISNISAGIGRGQMEVLEDRIQSRRRNHIFYKELFENFDDLHLFSEPSSKFYSNYWLNVVLVDSKYCNKEKLRNIFSESNIETRYLWKPMHMQTLYKDCIFFGNDISGAIFDRGLCLPSGSNITENCKERITRTLYNYRN